MTPEQLAVLAATVAEEKGWIWSEPAQATRHIAIDGSVTWEVISSFQEDGRRVRVTISEGSGMVLSRSYVPR